MIGLKLENNNEIPIAKIPNITDAKIPSSIARDSEVPSNSDIDARVRAGVSDWAETSNNTPIPAAKLSNAPSGGLSQSQVDARIASYARISPSGQIADAQIPASIARDSEVPSNTDIDGRIATWARNNSPSRYDSRYKDSIFDS